MAELKPGQPVACEGKIFICQGCTPDSPGIVRLIMLSDGEAGRVGVKRGYVRPATRAEAEAAGLWCGHEDGERIAALEAVAEAAGLFYATIDTFATKEAHSPEGHALEAALDVLDGQDAGHSAATVPHDHEGQPKGQEESNG